MYTQMTKNHIKLRIYYKNKPRAATQLLKDHAKIRSSSAPAARDRAVFSTGLADRGKLGPKTGPKEFPIYQIQFTDFSYNIL